MQFFLNGFTEGNPDVYAEANQDKRQPVELPDTLDVLIVGSGPAGLTLAAQLAAFPQIKTRIIEQKSGPMTKGQADGVSCRSMEMFQAFGFAEQIKREAYWVNEATFWKPDPENPQRIIRNGRIQDVEDGLSEMPHVILNQARVHDRYLELMAQSRSRLGVDYNWQLVDLISEQQDCEYPLIATLQYGDPDQPAKTRQIRARYVVGCDGARSVVRQAIGRELIGDHAYQSWGVMDVLAVTNFPDVRLKCIIKTAVQGTVLIIPREGGYLIRIYVELNQLTELGESRQVSFDQVLEKTRKIFKPYTFDVKEVVWWSVYEVGHSVTDKYDDVPAGNETNQLPHVFISGDACHTHSAKAGQGMNVSMGDSFNLGWKLISVLIGKSPPELLHTYSLERQTVAQDLIDFDHRWSRIMGAPPEEQSNSEDGTPLFQKHFIEHGRFTAGLSVKYQPSVLTGQDTWQHLATGFDIGMRFHSAAVIRLADAKSVELGHVIQTDARWHLFAFSNRDNPADPNSSIARLCAYLEADSYSPVTRHRTKSEDVDSTISVYGIFQQYHRDLDLESMPSLLKPIKGRLQLKDYEKMFCPDLKDGPDIFDLRGINRDRGCMVIVRPDQHVANILPLDAFEEIASFFSQVLL